MPIFGVDISRYQPASAMDGYSFVLINAEDPGFNGKVAHARELGIPWGPYSWVYPNNGRADIERAVNVCAPHGDPPLGYWLDYEQAGVEPDDIDMALDRARELGVLNRTGVYTYLYVLNGTDVENHLRDCPLWLAYYPGNNDGNYPPGQIGDAHRYGAVMWQYTSGANAGVGLDQNVIIDEPWYHNWIGQPPAGDDDMPYTDWPQADKDALTYDVMMAVLGGLNNVGTGFGQDSYGSTVKETLRVAQETFNKVND